MVQGQEGIVIVHISFWSVCHKVSQQNLLSKNHVAKDLHALFPRADERERRVDHKGDLGEKSWKQTGQLNKERHVPLHFVGVDMAHHHDKQHREGQKKRDRKRNGQGKLADHVVPAPRRIDQSVQLRPSQNIGVGLEAHLREQPQGSVSLGHHVAQGQRGRRLSVKFVAVGSHAVQHETSAKTRKQKSGSKDAVDERPTP
mmetsp:Transcript_34072/g.90810  ORF Transcript_34072/g.90810 Transcript_34072/m.90810 type:complete len:200 (-) Transcript_34072:1417-2016(-)